MPIQSSRLELRDRLIIALDVSSAAEARDLVTKIGDSAHFYKVGLQLFAAVGPQVVRDLVQSGKKVFLDLKFHDIPNTVAGAVKSASELGVSMLTVHAAGGSKMLAAAAEASEQAKSAPRILAVTMLTSLAADALPEIGIGGELADQVVRLAEIAKRAGCHGVVASPLEVSPIRKAVGEEMLIVTPGIRPAGSGSDDQVRTAGPAEALRAGATHLVVGRPITSAAQPSEAAKSILKDMASA